MVNSGTTERSKATRGKLILCSGKGGVGKTSTSAAQGLWLAQKGLKTLVVSADPAHSLADVLDQRIGPKETPICKNLTAIELEAQVTLEQHWGTIQEYIQHFLRSQGLDPLFAAELASIPGLFEILTLIEVLEYLNHYDAVVLDCAPTASTVSLLSIPDAMHWYMNKFFPVERRLLKTLKPIAERLTNLPLPEDAVLGQVEILYTMLSEVKDVLCDPTRCVIRLIATPDSVVLAETRRAHASFVLHQIAVDALVLNRVYPEELREQAHFKNWVEHQQANIDQVKIDLDIPQHCIPFLESEPIGIAKLEEISTFFEGIEHPLPHAQNRASIEYHQEENNRFVSLPLAETIKEELRLWVDQGDLVFVLSGKQKRVTLPESWHGLKVERAHWKDDRFRVYFKAPQKERISA